MLFHGSQARIEGPLVPAGSYRLPDRCDAHPLVYATPSGGWAVIFATARKSLIQSGATGSMHDAGDRIVVYHTGDLPAFFEQTRPYIIIEAQKKGRPGDSRI